MPAALAVDWSEVETLSIAIGVREAARKLGLNEESVKARCRREGWLSKRAQQQIVISEERALKRERQGLNPVAPNAADEMHRLGANSKLAGAIASNKALNTLADMDGAALLEPATAQSAKHWIGNAATVHSWQQPSSTGHAGVVVNVALLGHEPVSVEVQHGPSDTEVSDQPALDV